MRRESTARLDGVVVHDPQGLEAHVVGIEIVTKGKREPRLQPTVVGLAALVGGTLREGAFRRSG